jgi:hypothetical protein
MQLAEEYGITPKTLVKMLLRRGLQLPPGPVSPLDQEKIETILGPPEIPVTKKAT